MATPSPGQYCQAFRLAHLSKNFLVFIPLLASHTYEAEAFLAAGTAFLCFCLMASGSYLINDLMDLPYDRVHQWKKHRPLASGAISPRVAVAFAVGLFMASFLLALFSTTIEFVVTLFSYFALALFYSLWFKRLLLFDIVSLASLFTLRIIGGAAATCLVLSTWLVTFSIFIFFSLATVKRVAELVNGLKFGKDRAAGRAYEQSDISLLTGISIASGYLAVLTCALYVNSSNVRLLYTQPEILWLVGVVLLFWISRMVFLANRGLMRDDPVVFAMRDVPSLVCGMVVLCLFLAAKLLGNILT